jgi:hypothetical protein
MPCLGTSASPLPSRENMVKNLTSPRSTAGAIGHCDLTTRTLIGAQYLGCTVPTLAAMLLRMHSSPRITYYRSPVYPCRYPPYVELDIEPIRPLGPQ